MVFMNTNDRESNLYETNGRKIPHLNDSRRPISLTDAEKQPNGQEVSEWPSGVFTEILMVFIKCTTKRAPSNLVATVSIGPSLCSVTDGPHFLSN